tara:strand:+ start:3496 stop:3729 length:234 start_codon:yes stop_codon:yes gene_type:complete
MDRSNHDMTSLFAQLGIKNSDEEIESFIAIHRGIPEKKQLADADFWNTSQKQFLIEAIELDSDWSEVVDSLDAQLRA